jgi:hypothetical protein
VCCEEVITGECTPQYVTTMYTDVAAALQGIFLDP